MTCNPQSRKCDGNHGGPRCHDPECWNDAALEADEEGVLFGYMDRSVRVSQEAYAIFLDRERALEAQVAALSQQAEPECEWPTCECALEPERCKQAEPAPAAVPDSSDTFYAGLYKKSAPMWHRLHDLAVSKGYDHVRFAIECAPVYRCDCMGARKVAIDMAGNTIPCECVAAANEAEPVRCEYCDGTGDVHRADGEWLGECKECDAAEPAPAQDEREAFEAWRLEKFCGDTEQLKKCSNAPEVYYYAAEQEAWKTWRQAWRASLAAHPAQTAPQAVKLQHMAYAEDGALHWMSGRKIDHCELYAMPDFGRAPQLYGAPQPEQGGLVEAARGALAAIQDVLEGAYHNAYPECCGQAHLECCGAPVQAWSEADQKTMERFAPHEKALRAALTAQGGE